MALDQAASRLRSLAEARNQRGQRLDGAKDELRESRTQFKSMQRERAKLSADFQKMQTKFIRAEQENEDVALEIKELKEQQGASRSQLRGWEKLIAKLQKELGSAREQIGQSRIFSSEAGSRIDQLEKGFKVSRSDLSKRNQEVVDLQQRGRGPRILVVSPAPRA